MRKLTLIIAAIMATVGCKQKDAELTMLVGTYTDTDSRGIYTFRFNQETGDSAPLDVCDFPNPSFLAVTPDNKTVYAVTEQQVEAAVSALDFDAKTGALKLRSHELTGGRGTCHVTYVGKDVVATNYSSGSMSVFPLDGNGDVQPSTLYQFTDNGPDTLRQTTSHIHSTQVSPDGKFLFVINLGGDCIYRYPVADGKIADYNPVKISVPAGEGPRHFTWSKDARFMYVLTELGGDVLVFDYNGGDLQLIQTAKADPLGARGSADIHFSPDGKFLYASNRLKGDGIAIFTQDPQTGLLTWAGYQETAVHPRNFAITPNGKFVLVACRDGNVIQVFARDAKTGMMADTGKHVAVPHPVCVLTVPAE